jgi:hypothetical protein
MRGSDDAVQRQVAAGRRRRRTTSASQPASARLLTLAAAAGREVGAVLHRPQGNWALCRRVLPAARNTDPSFLPSFMVLFISSQSLNTFQVRYSLFRLFLRVVQTSSRTTSQHQGNRMAGLTSASSVVVVSW